MSEVIMSNDAANIPPEEFGSERAYLEGLLSTRINFYLVFVSFYFVAVFGVDASKVSHAQRAIALALGGVVSFFVALSVLRTTALVENVLTAFRVKYPNHPYTQAHKSLSKRWLLKVSAYKYAAVLPWGVTIAFFALALLTWRTA